MKQHPRKPSSPSAILIFLPLTVATCHQAAGVEVGAFSWQNGQQNRFPSRLAASRITTHRRREATHVGFPSTATDTPSSVLSNASKGCSRCCRSHGGYRYAMSLHGMFNFGDDAEPTAAVADKKSAEQSEAEDSGETMPFFQGLFSLNSSPRPEETIREEGANNDSLLQLRRDERLAEIEMAERRRQEQVRVDALPYLALFALQFLPLFGNERLLGVIYFMGVAVSTVYLGGRQQTVDDAEVVSRKNALAAPIGASLALGFLYVLIKFGVDPTALYAVGVSFFGALAISDVGVPILRNVVPVAGGDDGEGGVDWSEREVELPPALVNALDLGSSTVPLDGVITLLVGLACTALYWAPIAMTQKFLVSNAIAWSIAMVSLGAITLGSFQTGTILLMGLFAYDIFWVFRTDVMMTVAMKIEAPVKFLYTAPPSDVPRDYPFSVLGLGDIVVPGIFVRFMSKVDSVLKPQTFSYFNSATAAYAVGLAACFVANAVSHSGQPALLYLDPACIGSALACGAVNGQLKEVWNFELDEEDKISK